MRISDWSSDVCSSDLRKADAGRVIQRQLPGQFLTRQHMAFDLRRGDLDHVIDGKRGAQRREGGCCHRARSACHNAGGEHVDITPATMRSEERRVGKARVETCRSAWSQYPYNKQKQITITDKR